jgi:hypothetical protein
MALTWFIGLAWLYETWCRAAHTSICACWAASSGRAPSAILLATSVSYEGILRAGTGRRTFLRAAAVVGLAAMSIS